MDWFVTALLSVPILALNWLMLKKLQQNKVPHTYALGIYFILQVIGLIIVHKVRGIPFTVPTALEVGLFVGAALFSGTSNLLVMRSFERGPNPGITLALLATQSVWLLVASVFLFGSPMSVGAGSGVALIVLGIAALQIKSANMSRANILIGLLTGVLSAGMWFGLKGVQVLNSHYAPETALLYVILPQLVLYLCVGQCKKHKIVVNRHTVGWWALSGIIGTVVNVLIFTAVLTAPNPGYAHAITSANVLLTLVLAPLISDATLNWRQMLATLFIVGGVILIKLAS